MVITGTSHLGCTFAKASGKALSRATMTGIKDHALYARSKAAVEGFARSFAVDCGSKGITVNAIAPAGVNTDIYEEESWHYVPVRRYATGDYRQRFGENVSAWPVAHLERYWESSVWNSGGRRRMDQWQVTSTSIVLNTNLTHVPGRVIKLTSGSI